MIRMKEKRRVQAGKLFAAEELSDFRGDNDEFSGKVVSSWGPYTSIVGTAVKTGVAGLTTKAELTARSSWQNLASGTSGTGLLAKTGQDLAKAFGTIDTDGSGSISFSELVPAIRAVNPAATE